MGEGVMARKNLLASISEKRLTAVNSDDAVALRAVRSPPLAFAGRGALGAVTRTIDDLAARADAAKDLEARLAAGELVVDLDPGTVDGSFIVDRMDGDDGGYAALLEGIRAHGQNSPILVRPHPTVSGRYQVAFGHRRLRAAAELDRPVRAVVKRLSDRDLVLAQGQENSARANLSFIERARFARRLEADGYDRETIISALTTDKTTVSRMISVATHVPEVVIEAIGPAPGTGRDRWLELSSHYQKSGGRRDVEELLKSADFISSSSDERFNLVQEFLTRSPLGGREGTEDSSGPRLRARGQARHWSSNSGDRVAKVTETDRTFVLAIDRRVAPTFGDYLLAELDTLYEAYSKSRLS
jgi:ParB family transcriptional regulator, chromosome partitioning protein